MESFKFEKSQEKEVVEFLNALEKVRASKVFDAAYLENSRFVVFSDKSPFVYEKNNNRAMKKEEFSDMDFMLGKRTDFIAVTEKSEYENYTIEKLNDRQFIVFYFFNQKPSFEEFIAHEAAHNVFDLEYKKIFGEYEEKEGITEISDDYKDRMKKYIISLVKKYYPSFEIERFHFNRQPICEIYALLYEREFCKRMGINVEIHDRVEKNTQRFIKNPEGELNKFNVKYKRNCSMEDLFEENHMLSIIVAPLIEKEHADFNSCLKVFW